MSNTEFKRTLSPFMLWGLGVGYVISGMYFGWNLGLEKGGTMGMGIAMIIVMLMYVCFTFCYAELACAIPKAGGVFDYGNKAFGKNIGFIAGVSQVIEFIFAPPAIALAIGAYFNAFFPQVPVMVIAIGSYLLFTGLNIYGIKAAASFEVVITVIAVAELLLFCGLTFPSFQYAHLAKNTATTQAQSIPAAIPFAIWFYLGIEGVANVAEETKNPQRDLIKGFGWAIFTLVALSILVFLAATGVDGWPAIVYKNGSGGDTSDSPLPLALARLVGSGTAMYHMLITIGLFGLIASFHGLILAAGRATYEMGRVGNLPRFLGKLSLRFKTPAAALVVNMLAGIVALFTGKTAEIITLAVFGAISMYIIAMASLIALRRSSEPLPQTFKVPFYPLPAFLALVIAVACFVAMMVYNLSLGVIYLAIHLIAFFLFRIFYKQPSNENH